MKPQDANDAVKAGQGPFQPVSSPRTSRGVGPGEEGCRIWCVPGKAAWQPPAMAVPPVLLPPCNLGSDSLLLRRDSARSLNLWTSCPHPYSQRSQASCHLKIWAWTSRRLSPFPYRTGGQKQLSMQKYAGNVPGKVSAASRSMGWGLGRPLGFSIDIHQWLPHDQVFLLCNKHLCDSWGGTALLPIQKTRQA